MRVSPSWSLDAVPSNCTVEPTKTVCGGPAFAIGWLWPMIEIMRNEPGWLASVTCKVFCWDRETSRSIDVTCWEKSEGPAICTPLNTMVAEETRLPPVAAPFWMCSTKGARAHGGKRNVEVY